MRALKYLAMAVSLLVAVPASAQIMDSTGDMGKKRPTYGDTVYSSTWDRVTGKPATATRWPSWTEVTGKPATFPTTWDQIAGIPPVISDGVAGLDERYAPKGEGGVFGMRVPKSHTCSFKPYKKTIDLKIKPTGVVFPSGRARVQYEGRYSIGASTIWTCSASYDGENFGNCNCRVTFQASGPEPGGGGGATGQH